MPKISVIIPVFNVEEHIEACVQSVLAQTFSDIELICVDDASTDKSYEVLESLAQSDARIKLIRFDRNMSASQARKSGVAASTGDILMFLDSDDVLRPNACETVLRVMSGEDVDVVHFGAQIVNRSNVPEGRIRSNQKAIAPFLGRIDTDLLFACFEERRFSFTLWNKAFRGEVARRAFDLVEEGNFPRAQDLYAVFMILYFARSYVGIPDVLMQYNFGTGITGLRMYSLSSFERLVFASRVPAAIRRFLNKEGKEKKYGHLADKIHYNLLSDTLRQWVSHMKSEDMAVGFDILIRNWPLLDVISLVAEKSISEPTVFNTRVLAENIKHSAELKRVRPENIKVIGVFYYRYHSGGVQRVVSLLIPMFLKMGYKVVLITEEYAGADEYELPAEVPREIIPSFARLPHPDYKSRGRALARVIEKHRIDVFSSHASSGVELLFDMLVAQTMGCYFVLSRHELAFASFINGYELPVRQPSIFALADTLTCLTRMDEQYYRIMGSKAWFVPNPCERVSVKPGRAHLADNVVLWIGRLDYTHKQCMEPVEIMREVVRFVPDAKLLMVGGGWSEGAADRLKDRIRALKLENNVTLCGYTPNPENYYKRAACHLLTSAAESYSMVIQESRAYGVPLVLYELPYLELLKSGKGYISVRQGDRLAAAEAVVSLLLNPDLRQRIGTAAQQEFLNAETNSLCETRWSHILSSRVVPELQDPKYNEELLRMLMTNILELYSRGIANVRAEARRDLSKIPSLVNSTSIHNNHSSGVKMRNSGRKDHYRNMIGDLEKRRSQYGSIGAIDFLIKCYKNKIQ